MNTKVDKDRQEKFWHFEPLHKHSTTRAFETLIGATILELADFWFCQGSPFDHVCLARANWRDFASCWRLGEFYTRGELHLQLYAYTLQRASAIGMLLERGYEVLDRGLAANDRAFAVVVEALVLNYDDHLPNIVDWPARGRKRTLMIEHPRLLKAIGIVTGNVGARTAGEESRGGRAVPVRFRVQSKRVVGVDEAGKWKVELVEEVAFFRLRSRAGQVEWETEMEVVGKGDAGLIARQEEYEI